MKASPIYNIVNNPGRKSDCSFGVSNRFDQTIKVGTSSSNSHTLASITVERQIDENGQAIFTMWLDGKMVKRGLLNGKDFELLED